MIEYTSDYIREDFDWINKKINEDSIHDLHRKLFNTLKIEFFKNTQYWGNNGSNMTGVINTEFNWISKKGEVHYDPFWSNINFWDNNSLVHAENLNLLNSKYEDKIDYYNGDLETEWSKYVKYIQIEKNNIFLKDGYFFPTLMECVYTTRGIGDGSEKFAFEFLKTISGVTDVQSMSGGGNSEDFIGKDLKFKLFSESKTIQIKSFKKFDMFKNYQNKIVFKVPSFTYSHIDYVGFSNKNIEEVYIFENGCNYNKILGRYSFNENAFLTGTKNPF